MPDLESSVSRLRDSVLEHLPEGVLVYAENGLIVFSNQAADRLLGCKVKVGMSISNLFDPDSARNLLSPPGRSEGKRQQELILKRPALGGSCVVEAAIIPARRTPTGGKSEGLTTLLLEPSSGRAAAEKRIEQLQHDVKRLVLLNRVVRRALSISDLEGMLKMILAPVVKPLGWEGGAFFLTDREEETGHFMASYSLAPSMLRKIDRKALRRFLIGDFEVADDGPKPVQFQEEASSVVLAYSDLPLLQQAAAPWGFRSSIAVPLRTTASYGALCLFRRSGPRPSKDQLDQLRVICSQVAVAIENAVLLRTVSQEKTEWENTFNAVPYPICIIDRERGICRANKAANELAGSGRPGAVGLKCYELVLKNDTPCPGCPAGISMDENECQTGEIEDPLRKKTWSVTCCPLGQTDQRNETYIIMARDVTEVKTLHQRLSEAERLSSLGRLISGMAHQLNNPLTAIIGPAQLLLHDDLDDRTRKQLERIAYQAAKCRLIIQNLTLFARTKPILTEPMPVEDILEDVLKSVRFQLGAAGVSLSKAIPGDLPPVMGNRLGLRHALSSIIDNAIRAMRPGARPNRLTLRAGQEGENVFIEVEDTGPGVPEGMLDKVLEPFFTTREVGDGAGLGLSVAYGLVTEQNGNLSVRNIPGSGACVRIELPVVQARTPCPQPAERKPVEGRLEGRRILVVDDEQIILEMIAESLAALGCGVDCAADFHSAAEKILANDYDMLISDLKMPGVSGQWIYDLVARERPRLLSRLLIITGDTVGEEARSFLNAKALSVIEKPFDMDEFDQRVIDICCRTEEG